jgi:hypothetical protein
VLQIANITISLLNTSVGLSGFEPLEILPSKALVLSLNYLRAIAKFW